MHPMWKQRKLREVCKKHNIHVSAYSPLGGPGNYWGSTAVVDHPIIESTALKHNATPAQVSLVYYFVISYYYFLLTLTFDKYDHK